jgi:type VI secretion system protein ImpK
MSNPPDPPGGGKTVLRLNPGGRRAAPPAQPAYTPPAPNPPPYSPQTPAAPAYAPPQPPAGYGQQPPNRYAQLPADIAANRSKANVDEEWYSAPPPPPPLAADERPRALVLDRDVPIAANENIMLEAAGPLLLLLGRLRVQLMHANFANLMDQVADAIEEFDRKMRIESVPPEQIDTAKYAICATCDDIVQQIPSAERHVWVRYSMLTRFFKERQGGVRFFEMLDKAKLDPLTNYSVLELMYACMAMGFQGIHRTAQGGASTLQMIQRNLYEVLRKVRPVVKEDLSPHWRGQDLPTEGSTFRVPFWAMAALAALLLFAIFVTLRIRLDSSVDGVKIEAQKLFNDAQLGIERQAYAAPAPPAPRQASTQLSRVRQRLSAEIAGNKADATESGNNIIISVRENALFDRGKAEVLQSFREIATKIGAALEPEPGPIRVVGHADNQPIRAHARAQFSSNYELSVARARAVAEVLKPHISKADRFVVEGKGDTAPVATNETIEGRARNRRVEISIPREETLRR